VVDDSRVIRKVARRLLEARGYAVTEAENGAEALAVCGRDLPDAVLLDWNMPVMSGIEFLRALRQRFGPERPAVLFCTTENEMRFIEEALAAGAQEFIMKPFDADILGDKFAQVGLP
jgi:two-component system chemotaxis response regulator CheY